MGKKTKETERWRNSIESHESNGKLKKKRTRKYERERDKKLILT